MSAASSALPAVVQSADQAFTSTSSFMNAGNSLIKSFPFEEALEWSQYMSKERQQLKDNPAAQYGEPQVRCVGSGMTCCIPQKAVGPEWKKRPPYLNENDKSRACQAHFVPMQNAVCASTAYKDEECGIQRTETSQYIVHRHVMNIKGGKHLKAVCECRWARVAPVEPEAVSSLALSSKDIREERKIRKTDILQDDDDVNSIWIAPPGTLIEGFASWQLSKKALAEKQQQRGKTAKLTQGFGAALKATALLTQPQGGASSPGVYVHSAADALRTSLAGMGQEPSSSDDEGDSPFDSNASSLMKYGDTLKGGVEAVADLLMNSPSGVGLGNKSNLQNSATMMMVSRALDDLAYLQNKKKEN